MAENRTQPTDVDVVGFLAAVEPERKREDALRLDALFRRVSGFQPVIWRPSLVGYGRYHYVYKSGREGDFLGRLGKHKLGAACLYINKLADVDEEVLVELIDAGLRDLATHWPVEAN